MPHGTSLPFGADILALREKTAQPDTTYPFPDSSKQEELER